MKQRLKTILLGELVPELNRYKKPALAFAAVAAIAGPGGLGVWNAPAAHAQSASPKFEVASIKPSVDRLPTPEPVADKTGLEGRYKIDLHISTSLAADNQDTPSDPSLDAALAQLGLRLEKHKGPVKVPVLDHIEPPDAN
jgi:hypothetical protein